MIGGCIILDSDGNPREVSHWAAGEIIRLRSLVGELEGRRVKIPDIPYNSSYSQIKDVYEDAIAAAGVPIEFTDI